MTPPCEIDTFKAFVSANRSAWREGGAPSARSEDFIDSSSTPAVICSKARPAPLRTAARAALFDARTRRCWISGISASLVLDDVEDRRCGFFHRASAHIDGRPLHTH